MAEEKETDSSVVKRVARKLFPAYFALLLILSAGWIAITFLGEAKLPPEAVRLDLPDSAAPHGAAHAPESGHEATEAHGTPDDTAGEPDSQTTPGAEGEQPAAGQAGGDAHFPDPVKAREIQGRDLAPTPSESLKFGLVERVGIGALPRVASNGLTPMQAYAIRAPEGKEPRIAIVMGHLGISDSTARDAEKLLPKEITFSFSPYADGVDKLTRQARESGHEVLLEIPMEPENYPVNDAGPYTLRTGDSSLVMLQNLTWVMTRASYYVGLTNDQGQRFLSAASALTTALGFIHRRGLMFFENNQNQDSKGGTVAKAMGMPYRRADTVIDTTLTPQAIDTELEKLVEMAKKHGSATAYARPYPLTIERINRWAETLKRKGVVLAPVTAVVSPHKP